MLPGPKFSWQLHKRRLSLAWQLPADQRLQVTITNNIFYSSRETILHRGKVDLAMISGLTRNATGYGSPCVWEN